MKFYDVAKTVLKPVLMPFFFFPKVTGRENLALLGSEGAIMVCNHISIWDPVILILMTPGRRLNFMAKKQLFKVPVIGPFIKRMGAFSVDRKNADISAIRYAVKLVEDGHILGIFPEGTRSKTGEFRQFKYGAALVASRTRAKIIPVVIQNKKYFMRRPVISVGEPFALEDEKLNDTSIKNLESITLEMYGRMKRLKDEYRLGKQGRPLAVREVQNKY